MSDRFEKKMEREKKDYERWVVESEKPEFRKGRVTGVEPQGDADAVTCRMGCFGGRAAWSGR